LNGKDRQNFKKEKKIAFALSLFSCLQQDVDRVQSRTIRLAPSQFSTRE